MKQGAKLSTTVAQLIIESFWNMKLYPLNDLRKQLVYKLVQRKQLQLERILYLQIQCDMDSHTIITTQRRLNNFPVLLTKEQTLLYLQAKKVLEKGK